MLDARFAKHAPAVASQAAERALADAGLDAGDIDAVIISTCTGYLCPGLTSYVTERLGLPTGILALDLVGQGCGAALPNMRTSEALLASGRAERVLSICVEICSAAMYLDDDPGVLISACLFGDGAGAAVLTADPTPGRRRIEWKSAGTLHRTWAIARSCASSGGAACCATSCRPRCPRSPRNMSIRCWPKGSNAQGCRATTSRDGFFTPAAGKFSPPFAQRIGLTEDDTRWSAAILRDYGNVSSPCVYFVLQAALNEQAPGGYWWMSSFGAGFSCHGALLEVE